MKPTMCDPCLAAKGLAQVLASRATLALKMADYVKDASPTALE